jgi:methionine synthase I (cobalamin-dependent)
MTAKKLKERLLQDVLILDGAMGTQLFARGAKVGKCNDYLNIESPDIVLDVHKAYLDAGSDAVLTNTFGSNRITLKRHGHAEQVEQINAAGVEVARKAAGKDKYMLGDIGPCGDFLEPLGTLKPDELKAAFAEQAQALVDAGADGLIIETMTALDEIQIAVEAAKSVAGELPVLASMAFGKAGEGFKTMMGVDVSTAVERILDAGVDAVGFNCGTLTLEEYVRLAGQYIDAVSKAGRKIGVYAEPNAGKPELVDSKAVYRVTPAEFAGAVQGIHEAGINIVGGCCGTGPEHIAAVAAALKG